MAFQREVAGVGPDDATLFTYQTTHISAALFSDNPVMRNRKYTERKLRSRNVDVDPPHLALHSYIRDAGFIGASFLEVKADNSIVSALVERWRPETHTFMLPFGEATITLEDVHRLLGLRVDGDVVIAPMNLPVTDLCFELLGKKPEESAIRGHKISLSWLEKNFEVPKKFYDSFFREPDVVHQRYARAFLMRLIGGVLIPTQDSRMMDCGYLELLRDFDEAGQLSWGSAVLAHTYRGLCNATQFDTPYIVGATKLITLWAYSRIPTFFPERIKGLSDAQIYGERWDSPHVPQVSLRDARNILDSIPVPPTNEQWVWQPYDDTSVDEGAMVVPLILNNIIEGHQPDRVMRQFGRDQPIPAAPLDCDRLHSQKRTGRVEANWSAINAVYIELWNDREHRRINLEGFPPAVQLTTRSEYMIWYQQNSLRWYTQEARRQSILADGLDQLQHYGHDADVGPYAEYLSQQSGTMYHQRYRHVQPQVDHHAPPAFNVYQPPFSLNDNPSRRSTRRRPKSELRRPPQAEPEIEAAPIIFQSSWTYPPQPSYPVSQQDAQYDYDPWYRAPPTEQSSMWGSSFGGQQQGQWGYQTSTHDYSVGQTSTQGGWGGEVGTLDQYGGQTSTQDQWDQQGGSSQWDLQIGGQPTQTSQWVVQNPQASWDQPQWSSYSSSYVDPTPPSITPYGEGSSRGVASNVPTTQAERSAHMSANFANLNVFDDEDEDDALRTSMDAYVQSNPVTPPPQTSTFDMTLRGPNSMNPPQRYTPSEYEQPRRGGAGGRGRRGRRDRGGDA